MCSICRNDHPIYFPFLDRMANDFNIYSKYCPHAMEHGRAMICTDICTMLHANHIECGCTSQHITWRENWMLKRPKTCHLIFPSPHYPALTSYPTITLLEIMSIPSPVLSPEDFLAHVKSLGLDAIVTPFVHYQNRPVPSFPGGRYAEGAAQEWCDRMDTLLVCRFFSQCPSLT
jgi:hypothetical protein